MKRLESIGQLAEIGQPLCLAIGVFDGVHLGHKAVLTRSMQSAKQHGGLAVAVTFDPHPISTLRPGVTPQLLTPTDQKLALLEELGLPATLTIHFDQAFSRTPPRQFLETLAAAAHPLVEIVVGKDWSFGHNRTGSVALIREVGKHLGFTGTEIPSVRIRGERVSSTRIRQALALGDLALVQRLMGRPFEIRGTVVEGNRDGRKLGFPTANMEIAGRALPPDGVYAVVAWLEGVPMRAVANLGVRPTLHGCSRRLLEVHIPDFSDNLYGRTLRVQFHHYLRPERRFGSVHELQQQIQKDTHSAVEFLWYVRRLARPSRSGSVS